MRKLVLKGSGIHVLGRIFTSIACISFIFSIIVPFHHAASGLVVISERSFYSADYWSFKVAYKSLIYRWWGFGITTIEYSICQVGFHQYVPGPSLSWMFVLIFAFQLICLVTGVASVIVIKRILALIPLTSSSMVTLLMVHANIALLQSSVAVNSYQLGYWLTYPSILLFLISLILALRHAKKQINFTRLLCE